MSLRFIFALALLNTTGVRAGRVLLALYALNLDAQPATVGLVAATFSVFPMSLSWTAGRLADRYGSRWLLIFGALGGALGLLVPFFFPGMLAVFVAAAMNGLSFTFYNVSLQTQIGLLSPENERAKNFGTFSLYLALASFFGPLIAGLSMDLVGDARACLYLALFTLVPVAALAVRGHSLGVGTSDPAPSGGLRDLLATPGLWRVLLIGSVVVAGIDLFQFYLPIYGHGIGMSATAIGIVLSMFAGAAVVVRLVLPRLLRRFSEQQVLVWSFWVGAVSFVLVPFFQNVFVLGLLSFVFGLGMGCGQPITMMLVFSGSATGRSGEVVGVRVAVNHFTRAVAPAVFGAMASVFGLVTVFVANAVMLAAASRLARPGTLGERKRDDG